MAIATHAHEVHVAGGKARWAAPTDWRAKYGETPRLTRKQLVDAARARLAMDPLPALSVLSSPVPQSSRDRNPASSRDLDASTVRADGTRREARANGATHTRAPSAHESARATRGGSSRQRKSASLQLEDAGSSPAPRSGRKYDRDRVDAFIRETNARLTVKEQAAALGVPYGFVVYRRMALVRAGAIAFTDRRYHRHWTAEEDRYLQERVGAEPFEAIAKHLDRSVTSVIVRCKRAGISRRERKANRETLNASDVARILGQDYHFVARQLIAWGLLKATRHPWLTSAEGPQWAIRREDLVDFLLDYPWQYDRERITDPFFRRAADEAWSRDPLYTTQQVSRILGFGGKAGDTGHAVSSFLKNTAPKILPKGTLVVRRRGDPRATWSRSFAGMQCFIPRSTLRAIQASGWRNYRAVAADPNAWTVEHAVKALWAHAERPPYLRRGVLANRVRRFYQTGAIPAKTVQVGAGRRWLLAAPDAVLALRSALFARDASVLRLTPTRRALIERHDPRWLADPAELARGLADGRLAELFRIWWSQETRAAQELRHVGTKQWALITRHVARTLELLGPKTKFAGPKRTAIYHLGACQRRLVAVPLAEARRRGLRCCGWCQFQREHPTMRQAARGRRPVLVTCVACRTDFPRGTGRPPREPRCPGCRRGLGRAA